MNVGSDFVIVGLLDGQLYLEFNNLGGLATETTSVMGRSQQLYNDAEIHRLNFTFNAGEFELQVDGTDISVESKYLVVMKLLNKALQ